MHPNPNVDAFSIAIDCLERAGLRWMLVGSVAAYLYGHERSTHDIDIVFDPDGVHPRLVAPAFGPQYFLDEDMLADTLRTGMMANAIPLIGGPKIDLVPLKKEPFDQVAFRRRLRQQWQGREVSVIAPADLVISKLRWAKDSESERQLADVRAIMATGHVDEHDDDFNRWIDRLSLRDVLDKSRETRYEA